MIDVGSELAQARERRGLSLKELAHRTKISEATLRALERNDTRELPRGLYMRGFLRAYAREVGCDPEEIVGRYLTQFEDQEAEGNEPLDRSTANLKVRCDPGQLHSAGVDAMDRRSARMQVIGSAVVLVLGSLLYFSVDRDIHPTRLFFEPNAANAAQSRPAVEAAAPVEVGTGGSSSAPKSTDEESSGLKLDIQPRGVCWLSGTADGRQVAYRLLNPGERVQIEAHEDIVLRIGDAEVFNFTINGKPARPLGAAGEAVTIHLTRQNYQEFLAH